MHTPKQLIATIEKKLLELETQLHYEQNIAKKVKKKIAGKKKAFG